jgi:glycosyltransferase involved in cell wall biosynthesis
MKLSVIVATYNRKHELKELFESLTRQTHSPDLFEVVVVDDGSTDGTDQLINDIKQTAPFEIQYHYQHNKGPGYARTVGMEKARGDIFIFIDSDCIAPAHYLKTIADNFANEDIDAFGGPDRSAETFSSWDKAVNYSMTSFLTTGGLRGSAGKKLARYYPRSFNMGLRREVFEKIGGFGSIYHYGEDIEFSHRIAKSGARVVFLEDAYVYHKRRSSPGAFARQVYKMGKARVQLGRIDRELLEPLHAAPAVLVLSMVIVILASTVSTVARYIFTVFIVGLLILSAILILHGSRHTKDIRGALLIPVAFCLQLIAYGWGVIAEGVRTIIRR